MDETKLTAELPNMNVEIIHRAAPDGSGEMVTINLHATPDFRSALPLLAGMAQLPLMLGGGTDPFALFPSSTSPLALWSLATQAIMAPWLTLVRVNPFLAAISEQNSGTTKK